METRETIADRIVSMSATIRRSVQNSNVYGAYGIMSSHNQNDAERGPFFTEVFVEIPYSKDQ